MSAAVTAAACACIATVAAGVSAARLRDAWRVAALGPPRLRVVVTGQWTRSRDVRRTERELPIALEGVARALRSGANLVTALAAATPTAPPGLADEWRTLAAVAADRGVAAASTRWVSRSRASDSMRLAASALAVCADVGGPQARAIDGIASTLRDRLALAAELRALTAQARSSAAVIAIAPVFFAAVAGGLEPTYLPFLFGTAPGLACLSAGLALDAIGVAWMHRVTGLAA